MATPFLPGVVLLPARDDHCVGVAKRARDEDLLGLREEADARGWSSSVPERSLALRRRRGPASSSSTLGCGWAAAAATAEEHGCRREEAETPEAVGAVAEAEETAMVDPCFVAYFCNRDVVAFDPPPMTTPLLPLTAFIADFLESRNDDRAAKRACDRDLLALSEEANARGWSSAAPERSFAPRRRRGPVSSSSHRGCGEVADTADELAGRPGELVAPDAVGSGPAAAEETAIVDPYLSYFCLTL